MADVTMPQLGETVTEGTITKWFKAVGDQVARDEPLFEVSTDKVDSEVPSPAEGVLTAILVQEGDTVDVGVTLAVIGDEAARPTAPSDRPPPRPPSGTGAPPPPPLRAATVAADGGRPAAGTGPAAGLGAAHRRPVPGARTGPGRLRRRSPRRRHRRRSALVLSPVVRRLLNEHDIDPATVRGTGLGGRITRRAIIDSRPPPRPPPAAASSDPAPAPASPRRRHRAPHRPRRHRGTAGRSRRPARRRGRPLHQHPAPHRRAHGPLQGHLGPHADGQGDRLRAGRAGPPGPRRPRSGPRRASGSPIFPSPPGPRSRRWPSSPISTPRSGTTP